MGYIRKLDANVDPQTFPGAKFEAAGDVPAPQCSEARIEGTGATTSSMLNELHDPNKFAGESLDGKICHITASVGGNTGDFTIAETHASDLTLATDPGDGTDVEYYISDGGALILTRDIPSFAAYIHAAGYAYTIKGGKLYTDMPSGQLKHACTILFDPLT